MSDPSNWTGNGAIREAGPPRRELRSIGEHARRVQDDATKLASEVRETTADLESYLTEQVHQRPVVTLGAAAALGYVLGGGLRTQFTVVLLGLGARLAMALTT